MIIRGQDIPDQNGRKGYPIAGRQGVLHHLAVRVTTPANPFKPHRHEAEEIWYIIAGRAWVNLDGQEHEVATGDVILLAPWVEHGLRTDGEVTWMCLG
ncbi:MAG: cupin domain-containing protein [Anaerolineae bacterium]